MLKGLHIIAYLNTVNCMEIRTVNFQEEKRKKKGMGSGADQVLTEVSWMKFVCIDSVLLHFPASHVLTSLYLMVAFCKVISFAQCCSMLNIYNFLPGSSHCDKHICYEIPIKFRILVTKLFCGCGIHLAL